MNVGQFDQMKAALTDLAEMLMDYYKKLISIGFTPEQAIRLTINFQTSMMIN